MTDLIARVTAWALALKPVRAFFLYLEHRGPILADSITYRTLFSVFAGVLLGFSLASLWLSDNPAAWQALIDAVDAAIPGLLGENGVIDPATIKAPTALTLATILSLVGLVGAAIGAIGSLRTALRMLADQVHDNVFWVLVMVQNFAIALVIGAGFLVSAAATFYGTAFIDVVKGWFGIGTETFADAATRAMSIGIVFVLDALLIALLFRLLSGLKPSARSLWSGALLGAVALTVLQQLSGLFIAGAGANPLLATFASLIALLLWLNLSAQVILIASAYIITGVEEETDRVRARYGSPTFAQRALRRAEDAVTVATAELARARKDAAAERDAAAKRAAKKTAASV